MLKYYFARIQLLMARISMLLCEVHPTNRPLTDYWARDWASTYYMDELLAGVHEAIQDVYDDDELFGKFKEHVLDEEARMKDRLETVLYNIDAVNTLDIVTGSGRLEKVASLTPRQFSAVLMNYSHSTFSRSFICSCFAS